MNAWYNVFPFFFLFSVLGEEEDRIASDIREVHGPREVSGCHTTRGFSA